MTEPRALTAALSSPAFVTRAGGLAMHVAHRHVERWAPETGASRIRPLRNLGFVDRLVSPWLEASRRSASLRMFDQYLSSGTPERAVPITPSWVFPRPWYQDELDWMAAARHVGAQSAVEQAPSPSMLTTRGTYVAPAQVRAAIPAALYEYVAPSLSVARPDGRGVGGDIGATGAYSPLVPFAATAAAHVMQRAVAPITSSAVAMSPGLRSLLATMLDRATRSHDIAPTRASQHAPELVTPPAPRPHVPVSESDAGEALHVAEHYAEQHARLVELQRTARAAAERELAVRLSAEPSSPVPSTSAPAAQAERQRIDDRVAQRLAAMRQHEAARLHEQARALAARDARSAAITPPAEPAVEPRLVETRPETRISEEVAAAVAALPVELASMVTANISRRPERAVQAIAELGEALRTVELMARSTATGAAFEATRGPRVLMPAGLGGLVATVERTTGERAAPRVPMIVARPQAPVSALAAATSRAPTALSHVAWSDRWLARFAGARPRALEVLEMAAASEVHLQSLASAAPRSVFVAPAFEDRSAQPREARGESGVDVGFASAGARPGSRGIDEPLPTLRGGPAPAQPIVRFDDDAETPDDMLAAIAMAATQSRAAAAPMASSAPVAPSAPTQPTIDPERYQPRETVADLVAHAAPAAPGAGMSVQLASSPFAPALRHVLALPSAPSFDVRSLFGAGLSATYLAGLVSAATDEIAIAASAWGQPVARSVGELELPLLAPEPPRGEEDLEAPLSTMRSALLAWEVETSGADVTLASAPRVTPAPLARSMVEALALPMLDDRAAPHDHAHVTHAAPGMVAERAHAWSVAQERSSADLAFDFVPPELVLAARVYGLGPAEAAQAARLAIVGGGQLSAMAAAVDRAFVQALAIESERRGERTRGATAYPVSVAEGRGAAGERVETSADALQFAQRSSSFAQAVSSFGVARRAPRGAFLWPAGTTAVLGLTAPPPDGDHAISVAALELLAAQAVAELGTYTALGEVERDVLGEVERGVLGGDGAATSAASPLERDNDVLAAASALVPAARRDKFEALYVALGQSPSARAWSPAARAARALALAGRGDDSITARERATVAWDVLPVVYGIGRDEDEAPLSTGDAAARAARRREELRAEAIFVDSRPGLGALSARAGEALGSYVAPASAPAPAASASSSRDVGAVLRPPTAAPELVQTGRGGRHGGGEVEIPPWFEAAARKMFEERGVSGISEGISIAELTLVTAAPATQIAASSRAAGGSAAPVAPSTGAAANAQSPEVDVEQLANDVYREVLVLMDLARARNGEPYL